VGVLLVVIPVVIILAVAYVVYVKGKHAKGELAPEETPDETRPRPDRDKSWDPNERYDDGEPPAAR
jgi:hypothetical protein